MFTYIDPQVRERLTAEGKLVRIDAAGRALAAGEPAPTNGSVAGPTVLNVLGPIPLPLQIAGARLETQWYAAVRRTELKRLEELAAELRESGGQKDFSSLATSMAVNSVLIVGSALQSDNPLVRVHSSCMTGDVFGSERCECGPQLESALNRIAEDPAGGILIYMAGHEGRGIGLWAKAVTYLLQDAGDDTYGANRALGLPDDSRDFGDAAALLLYFLSDRPLRLLTNNPKKVTDLEQHGVRQVTPVKHLIGVGQSNRRYLEAKRNWGHHISEDDLGG
jgi:GTP cyclohydrolase II